MGRIVGPAGEFRRGFRLSENLRRNIHGAVAIIWLYSCSRGVTMYFEIVFTTYDCVQWRGILPGRKIFLTLHDARSWRVAIETL
jgi:hypothetical protein